MPSFQLSSSKPGVMTSVVALGVVLLIFLAICLGLLLSPSGSEYDRLRAQKRYENLAKLREENAKKLGSYAWIDKSKGVVQIPIDRAMQLTAAKLAESRPTAVATPTP